MCVCVFVFDDINIIPWVVVTKFENHYSRVTTIFIILSVIILEKQLYVWSDESQNQVSGISKVKQKIHCSRTFTLSHMEEFFLWVNSINRSQISFFSICMFSCFYPVFWKAHPFSPLLKLFFFICFREISKNVHGSVHIWDLLLDSRVPLLCLSVFVPVTAITAL